MSMLRVRGGRLGAVVVVAAGLLVGISVTAPPVFAAPSSWAELTPPDGAGRDNEINAVSCTTRPECVGVGEYQPSSTGPFQPLAMVPNAASTGWVPKPAATVADGGELLGVSCNGGITCVAVGFTTPSSGISQTLTELWNGNITSTPWMVQSSPDIGTGNNLLAAVNCPININFCMAVGNSTPSPGVQAPMAQQWNGGSWAATTLPLPAAATTGYLTGVSCTSTTSCVAVGVYQTSTAVGPLVETFNGTSWTAVTPSIPAGTTAYLEGVSCAAATSCQAVGTWVSNSGGGGHDVMLAGAGSTWTATESSTAGNLTSVACTSTTACLAVGNQPGTSAGARAQAMRLTGTTWKPTTIASEGTTDNTLTGVGCVSATGCLAFGYYTGDGGDQILQQQWNGTTWTLSTPPSDNDGGASNSLYAVSCVTVTFCVAIGVDSSQGGTIYALSWNGNTWAQMPPLADTSGLLGDMSCTSPTFCMLVSFTSGNPNTRIAQMWDGVSWTLTTLPAPNGPERFDAVSCASPTLCIGGGFFGPPALWNGSTWTDMQNPFSGTSEFNDVSCPTTTNCIVVGSQDSGSPNDFLAVVAQWNGSTWTTTVLPQVPAGNQFYTLDSVSCPTANTCFSIGDYSDQQGFAHPLAYSWDGSAWTNQPIPAGTANWIPLSVSCLTATNCVADGGIFGGNGGRILQWDAGQWSTITLATDVAGATLYDISCPQPIVAPVAACTAVGGYSTASGNNQNLSETGTVSPTTKLAPKSGTVGSTVKATSTGFSANGTATYYWDSTSNPAVTTVNTGTGSFTTKLTVPPLVNGTHHLLVKDALTGIVTSTAFTVKAKVVPSPTSGHAGSSVQATVTGFPAGQTVTLRWNSSSGTVLTTTTTDATGSATKSFTVPSTATGTYKVFAVDGGLTASATFTVN
jgi:hypothetical protein